MAKTSLSELRIQLQGDLKTMDAIVERVQIASDLVRNQITAIDSLADAMRTLSDVAGPSSGQRRGRKPTGKKRGVPKGTIRSPKTAAILDFTRKSKGPVSPAQVKAALDKKKMPLTVSGVNQVLNRLPQIKKVGRGQYQYKG